MQERLNGMLRVGSAQAAAGLRWLFFILLVLMIVPSGSVNFVSLHVIAIGLFFVAALATLAGAGMPATGRAWSLALLAALLLAAWIVIQAYGFAGNPLANPIWSEAERFYGPMPESISVSPGDTMQGLIAALLPFAAFMTTLSLFRNDREALGLIHAIVLPGIAFSIIGIIQYSLFPNALLFEAKQYYLDSLTAVFINRNTAATYLAMIMVFAAGLAFHRLQGNGIAGMVRTMIGARSDTRRADAVACALYTLGFAIVFVALMLTKSRAGIASGIIGLSLTLAILAYHGTRSASRNGFATRRTPFWARLGRATLVLVAVAVLGAAFAGQALLRAEIQGTADLRFCYLPGLIQMARDNWLVGTGFGTFRDVFPAYRDPACGMEGVLVQAHNFYLEGWITLGLLFPILAVAVMVALAFYLVRGLNERRHYRWIPAAGIGVLALQLLHNSVDFSIQNPGVSVITAVLMGASVVVATGRSARARARSEDAGAETLGA